MGFTEGFRGGDRLGVNARFGIGDRLAVGGRLGVGPQETPEIAPSAVSGYHPQLVSDSNYPPNLSCEPNVTSVVLRG